MNAIPNIAEVTVLTGSSVEDTDLAALDRIVQDGGSAYVTSKAGIAGLTSRAGAQNAAGSIP